MYYLSRDLIDLLHGPDRRKELIDQIVARAKEDDVVLLFGAKDEKYNNAVALKEYIDIKMKIHS